MYSTVTAAAAMAWMVWDTIINFSDEVSDDSAVTEVHTTDISPGGIFMEVILRDPPQVMFYIAFPKRACQLGQVDACIHSIRTHHPRRVRLVFSGFPGG